VGVIFDANCFVFKSGRYGRLKCYDAVLMRALINIMKLTDKPFARIALNILNAALDAVDPYSVMLGVVRIAHMKLHVADLIYDLRNYDRVIVVGAGKATARMALGIEALLGNVIDAGLIIVKVGHTEKFTVIDQVESSHPIPGIAAIEGTRRILEMVKASNEKTLIICLLSGGASALLVAPVEKLTLQDKQETTSLLLNAGATITELNTVRKHLSAVKGGRLAQAAFPAQILTLIVSDVNGDPIDIIASGPTAGDGSTFVEAWEILTRYKLAHKLSFRVADYLQRGISGQVEESVKQHDPCLHKVRNVIISNISQALLAAQKKAEQLGLFVKIITRQLNGEARIAARYISKVAREELALTRANEIRCLLFGGETTVTVRGTGLGGRNQELALAFALEIEGVQSISLLSAGTDGTDGPNDAAGAMVDGDTIVQAREVGIDPTMYLANNDAYHFFEKLDALTQSRHHLITGPTGTNVMDIHIVIINKKEGVFTN